MLCKKVGSKGLITSEFIMNNDKMLLLKDQDNPTEQMRKVIISKSEGVLAIAISTKLLPVSYFYIHSFKLLLLNGVSPSLRFSVSYLRIS